jgi:hypothetical protein
MDLKVQLELAALPLLAKMMLMLGWINLGETLAVFHHMVSLQTPNFFFIGYGYYCQVPPIHQQKI